MRLLIVLIIVITFPAHLVGQTKLSQEEQNRILERIDVSASEIRTMRCDFIQTKSLKLMRQELVSKGLMSYQRPDKVCWQYVQPYEYSFVVNGTRVRIKSSKSVQKIDTQKNKMFQKISGVIFQCVTGEGLKDSKDFRIEMYSSDGAYYARLHPKKKEIKQVYSLVEVFFNKSLSMVERIRMEEPSGDFTLIELKNVQLNKPVQDSLFLID